MTHRSAAKTLSSLRPIAQKFCITAALSVVVVQLVLNWLVVCGTSSASILALLGGLAGGFGLTGFAERRLADVSRFAWASVGGGLAILSGLIPSALDSLLTLGTTSAASMGSSAGLAFAVPMLLATGTTLLAGCWWRLQLFDTPLTAPVSLVAIAAGCLAPLANVMLLFSLSWLTIGFVVAATALTLFGNFAQRQPNTGRPESGLLTATLVSLTALAVFAHAALRYAGFLSPVTVPVLLLAVAVTCLVLPLSRLSFVRNMLQRREVPWLVLVLMCLLPATFGTVVNLNLQWNASVNSAWQILLLRAMLLSSGFLMALAAARLFVLPAFEEGNHAVTLLTTIFLGLAVGGVLQSVGMSVGVQVIVALAVAMLPAVSSRQVAPAWTGGLLAAGLLCAMFVRIDSTVTSQKLFSARTASGLRNGLSMDLVEQSHCTRLVDDFASESGHLTIWKTSADMLEVRRDGIPDGLISTNELTTPQPLAEVLTTVLPLTMHPQPRDVLLLCDDTGVGTRVCCNFPLARIESVLLDAGLTEFAATFVWNSLTPSPLQDDRVEIRHESVATAIRRAAAGTRKFDVLIAASPNPVSLLCQHQLTQEFYSNVRNALRTDGVFCQRITQHDLGAAPIHRLLSTLSSVFPRVVVVQMAPGEMALVAGVAEDGLLDAGLLGRMQRSHVTRELARSGWDWSQLAALPVVDTRDELGIYEHAPPTAPLTAASSHFALSLPLESARWGNKAGEVRSLFAPHQRRLADAAPRTEVYKEFARRYSAVVQQMEIVTTFYDQPWPYRQSLKTEMKRNPRPAIQSIGENGIRQRVDPRDEYRKHYFVTLGSVLQQAKDGFTDPLALRELTSFTHTYEPLMTYFAHHELIRIHEAIGHPSPAAELRHRLHTVFFADGRDYSIGQVTAAMQQIVDDPELLASEEARFDHLNAMLQELVRRWEGRRSWSPPSARRTQADIDRSIKVANKALDMMGDLAPSVNMSRAQFLARRRFINRTLVGPLRSYSEQVLAHRIKTEPATGPLDLNTETVPMLLSDDEEPSADDSLTN
ncbi:MAG: hypothetical protein NXI04_10945 [Planctomycetaceae bacterium]|nr:hypothetical protein [Planctomycetaceae bacterium]